MHDPGTTQPIEINNITFGDKEAEIRPFENAAFDFAKINEYLLKNPAVREHIIPDALVSSCSECCMEYINGRPNILGRLFRQSRGEQGCRFCPVSLASEKLPARMGDGSFLRNGNGGIISAAEAVRMAEDGEA